jgi:hypothetical protein
MTYRILSIDGGGIRGVLAARMLQRIEERLELPLRDHFDLIAGTSTGSMVGAAIAMGIPCEEIVQLYRKKSKKVFPYRSRWTLKRLPLLLQHGPSAPKFSEKGLTRMLKDLLGNKHLSDINPAKLLITSYDTIGRSPIIFKSWKERYANVPVWEACLCSASAPTFFPAHRLVIDGQVMSAIDGGLAANNPTACAVAEAIRLGHRLEDLEVISIGTGAATRVIPWEQARSWGTLQWIWGGRVVKVMTDAPCEIYDYITDYVIGDKSRYARLQFPLDRRLIHKPLSDDMDDASQENINNLVEAADAYMNLVEVVECLDMCLRKAEPPQVHVQERYQR